MLRPLRKIQALLWRTNLKHRRIPSTVHDCIDAPPPQRQSSLRVWFAVATLLAVLYCVYLLVQMPRNYEIIRELEISDMNVGVVGDIEIKIPQKGNEGYCGFGCDFEALSSAMKKRMNRFFKDFSGGTPPCEIDMFGRGAVVVNSTVVAGNLSRWYFPTVRVGGYHTPDDCQSRHKVAIIVPYRDNEPNLKVFLFNMHPFLIRQRIEYRIFVVQQKGDEALNKGLLLNAGFEQSHRFGNWHCLVFHDVDLLPLDERILYTCPTNPRHMSATVLGHKNDIGYKRFGGVVSMRAEQFLTVNGYSNSFWGCCDVDSNMFWRIRLAGLRLGRYDRKIAKYLMLPPSFPVKNYTTSKYHQPPVFPDKVPQIDGLSTTKYKVMTIRLRTLYTHIVVDLKANHKLHSKYKFWLNK